jgi:cysteine-rich repeat protein
VCLFETIVDHVDHTVYAMELRFNSHAAFCLWCVIFCAHTQLLQALDDDPPPTLPLSIENCVGIYQWDNVTNSCECPENFEYNPQADCAACPVGFSKPAGAGVCKGAATRLTFVIKGNCGPDTGNEVLPCVFTKPETGFTTTPAPVSNDPDFWVMPVFPALVRVIKIDRFLTGSYTALIRRNYPSGHAFFNINFDWNPGYNATDLIELPPSVYLYRQGDSVSVCSNPGTTVQDQDCSYCAFPNADWDPISESCQCLANFQYQFNTELGFFICAPCPLNFVKAGDGPGVCIEKPIIAGCDADYEYDMAEDICKKCPDGYSKPAGKPATAVCRGGPPTRLTFMIKGECSDTENDFFPCVVTTTADATTLLKIGQNITGHYSVVASLYIPATQDFPGTDFFEQTMFDWIPGYNVQDSFLLPPIPTTDGYGRLITPRVYTTGDKVEICSKFNTTLTNQNCESCNLFHKSWDSNFELCGCLMGYERKLHPNPIFGYRCEACQSKFSKASDGAEACIEGCIVGYEYDLEQEICKKCPVGFTKQFQGTDTCVAGCVAGYEYNTTSDSCTKCRVNFKKDTAGTQQCERCDSLSGGINTCSCNTGTQQNFGSLMMNLNLTDSALSDLTDAGSALYFGLLREFNVTLDCELCPVGTYQDEASSKPCKSCPMNSITSHAGSTHVDNCNICLPGYFLNTSSECEVCPRNSENPDIGSVGLESCRPCIYLYFQPETGKASCVQQNVDLDVDINDYVVGIFVDGNTSCAYVARYISGVTDLLCWGSLWHSNNSTNSFTNLSHLLLGQNYTSIQQEVVPPLTPVCGDGIVFPLLEQCDDGNLFGGDGCTTECKIETGFYCEFQTPKKDLYESLWAPSQCCRTLQGLVAETAKCTSCAGRLPPYPGVYYDAQSCELHDIDECASLITNQCFRNSKLCLNLDAVSDPQQTFKCLCASPLPENCEDIHIDNGAYTVRGVISVPISFNYPVDYTPVEHILKHATQLSSQIVPVLHTSVVELLQTTNSSLITYYEILFLCESWHDMQLLASQLNLTDLLHLLL